MCVSFILQEAKRRLARSFEEVQLCRTFFEVVTYQLLYTRRVTHTNVPGFVGHLLLPPRVHPSEKALPPSVCHQSNRNSPPCS
jgi:hypothetical protein